MVSQIICEKCENKCIIDIYRNNDNYEFYGADCSRGIETGKEYIKDSKRIFTTVVRVKSNRGCKLVPVKSNKIIEMNLWIECSKALGRVYVGIPIKTGDVICRNILNTGVDIICAKNID